MKIIALIITISVICCLAFNGIASNITLSEIKDYIRSFGPLAPAIYILAFTLVPLTLIPNSLIAISGGAIFGIYYGTLYTILGALCGATLAFGVSRYFGKEMAAKLIRHKAEWLEGRDGKGGFMIILLLRLIPIVPFDVISYGAGLSKINYCNFIGATLFGILPGVLVYSNIGDKASNLLSVEFWLALGMLAALVFGSHLLKKRFTLKKIQKASNALCHSDY